MLFQKAQQSPEDDSKTREKLSGINLTKIFQDENGNNIQDLSEHLVSTTWNLPIFKPSEHSLLGQKLFLLF